MDHGGELDKSFRPTSPWWVGNQLALTVLNTAPGVRGLPRCSVEVWARRPARQGWGLARRASAVAAVTRTARLPAWLPVLEHATSGHRRSCLTR